MAKRSIGLTRKALAARNTLILRWKKIIPSIGN
jgi:hypothetical protein